VLFRRYLINSRHNWSSSPWPYILAFCTISCVTAVVGTPVWDIMKQTGEGKIISFFFSVTVPCFQCLQSVVELGAQERVVA